MFGDMLHTGAKNEILRLFAAAFTTAIVAVKLGCVNEMRLGFLAGTKRNLQRATCNLRRPSENFRDCLSKKEPAIRNCN